MTILAGFSWSGHSPAPLHLAAQLSRCTGEKIVAVAVAGLVLVYSFVQAYLGDEGMLNLHIPGALFIVVATVWLTAWLFSPSATDRVR